jgi:hypothetical protein
VKDGRRTRAWKRADKVTLYVVFVVCATRLWVGGGKLVMVSSFEAACFVVARSFDIKEGRRPIKSVCRGRRQKLWVALLKSASRSCLRDATRYLLHDGSGGAAGAIRFRGRRVARCKVQGEGARSCAVEWEAGEEMLDARRVQYL